MPTEREYLQKLKEFDREWKDTEPAQEGVFDPLPPGSYEAILIDASLTESSTGTVGLNCQFEVTKGDHEGRYLFHTFWVTGKNLPYVKRDMGVLGYYPVQLQKLSVSDQLYPAIQQAQALDYRRGPQHRIPVDGFCDYKLVRPGF